MRDFIKRLSSRKFLLALGACLTFYANKQYTELAATAIAYLAAEGGADALERRSAPTSGSQLPNSRPFPPAAFNSAGGGNDDVDSTTIVSGDQ